MSSDCNRNQCLYLYYFSTNILRIWLKVYCNKTLTGIGFEPTHAEYSVLAVHHLNHSAIPPHTISLLNKSINIIKHCISNNRNCMSVIMQKVLRMEKPLYNKLWTHAYTHTGGYAYTTRYKNTQFLPIPIRTKGEWLQPVQLI